MPILNFDWIEPERPHTGQMKPLLWLALTLKVMAYCKVVLAH